MLRDSHKAETTDPRAGNRVLAGLPDEEFDRLRPHLDPFEMQAGEVLAHAGDPISHVFFVQSGMVSMLASTAAGSTVEVAFVGHEGMAGAVSLLGGRPLLYNLVAQLPGRGWRVRAETIRDEVLSGGQLVVLLHHCLHILIAQLTQAAVCARFHSPRQRLCRWLAHTFDLAGTDRLPMTHEFIATMIGGARSLVTQTSTELRDLRIIDYQRGRLQVLDPRGLRDQACECYRAVTSLFDP